MPTFSERLRQLRTEHGWSQQVLANQLKVSKSSINMYERGEREPGIELLESVADIFNVDMDYLIGRSDIPNKHPINDMAASNQSQFKPDYSHIKNVVPIPKTKEIPIIGSIACGTPILAEQNIDGQVKIPEFVQADFALRCNGDSMIGAHIRDGDLVCIRIQPDVDDGQIAAVLIGEDATLKRVYHRPDGVMLVAENPSFPPMVYIGEECEDIRILGKAITCISRVR